MSKLGQLSSKPFMRSLYQGNVYNIWMNQLTKHLQVSFSPCSAQFAVSRWQPSIRCHPPPCQNQSTCWEPLFNEDVNKTRIVKFNSLVLTPNNDLTRRERYQQTTAVCDPVSCCYVQETLTWNTPRIISAGRRWFTVPFERQCVCVSLFISLYTHRFACVCVHISGCVGVFDLLTHVFNWNSMQSARCSTNNTQLVVSTQILYEPFPFFGALRSHTVRQDHRATPSETDWWKQSGCRYRAATIAMIDFTSSESRVVSSKKQINFSFIFLSGMVRWFVGWLEGCLVG